MDIPDFLSHTFLFKGLSAEEIGALLPPRCYRTDTYARGAVVLAEGTGQRGIGFVIRGECEVRRERPGTTPLVLNRLGPTDAFGVLTVFAPDRPFPTEILTRKASQILFMPEEAVLSLLKREARCAIAVAYFLGDRIRYLNQEIATIGAGSVEARLAAYLTERCRLCGCEFSFSCAAASRAANIGRASLYRALEHLQAEGILLFQNQTVKILEPERLERMST